MPFRTVMMLAIVGQVVSLVIALSMEWSYQAFPIGVISITTLRALSIVGNQGGVLMFLVAVHQRQRSAGAKS